MVSSVAVRVTMEHDKMCLPQLAMSHVLIFCSGQAHLVRLPSQAILLDTPER